jgi:hypothetical protein
MVVKKKSNVVEHEELKLVAVRIEASYHDLLAEVAADDPDRATVSTLIRRAIREYLQRQKKLKP